MPWSRILLFLIGLAIWAGPASAQVTVVGVRDLTFGNVLQGVRSTVSPADPVRSGMWDITAVLGARVRVRFTLPNRLNGPAGAQMRIRFRNNSAIAVSSAPSGIPVTFNPNSGATFRLQTSKRFFVFLGGEVNPAGNQAPGAYSNIVVLTLTVF